MSKEREYSWITVFPYSVLCLWGHAEHAVRRFDIFEFF